MLPYKTLLRIDKSSRQAVYLQIAGQFIGLIQDGLIQPGTYLPGSRVLAELLDLHRKTVIAAYDELQAQDWITAIPRKGMMVSENLPEIKPRSYNNGLHAYAEGPQFPIYEAPTLPVLRSNQPSKLVINDGFPDARLAPLDEWARECRSIIQRPAYHKYLAFGPAEGNMRLRKEMLKYLADTRGLNIREENVMITRGAQMSIYLAAAMIIQKGDHIIVGSPNYFYADLAFEQLGAHIIRVPVDEDGIDTDMVEQLCRTKKIKMLYIISHHHHPTTVTLSAERRMKLLEIIRKHKLAVIEDDYDFDFHYSAAPIVPLASADHGGNVIYVGSFTKSLGLSLRIGFMIAPEKFIRKTAALRRLMDLGGDNLVEEALAGMLENGTITRHLKKANKLYWERRDLAGELLIRHLPDEVSFRLPQGGMAIWLQFAKHLKLPVVADKAAELGLSMTYGYHYAYKSKPHNGMRFGFASLNNRELVSVVQLLAKAVKS
ncbi:GntR family transcriptional regulator/MocR family aminotransferase [Chitinophaga dinghuensis]|uniref:GntR family transcriptional regulator/MocR family aminotransferase n=1 Tax=Chitinophaga dinghuensis TaxID=1539050 RepID=A0A327VV46_9BACT|nr:PLP-dependent aminotransferase family protein [Chitinophaga dinghuensis]RAJ79133.1 GntR family transcriptional regulator/MocR family aminotransferase [Chitinophaga dinghuensis]